MTPVLHVPRAWSELTPAWLTAALARSCPGAVVGAVRVGEVRTGTNSRASVEVRYAAGTGPERVFVKLQGRLLNRLALVALRALGAEAQLFESGVALPLEHPHFYAGALDRRRLSTAVVMQDVTTRSGRPNDALTPLRVEEVRHGLEGLARLHAAYWDRPLPSELRFLRPWRLGRTWAPVSRASLGRGRHRLRQAGRGGLVPPAATLALLERQFRASATLAATGPQAVLHGDPHPGNTFALPGWRTGFYDWQLVRTGHWSHDVGYFLVSSLDVADRRAHERDLLEAYLDALRRRGPGGGGVEPPRFADAWDRYRATPAFGLCTWLHTLAFGSFQPAAVCLATLERFAAAYQDLETPTAAPLARLTQP